MKKMLYFIPTTVVFVLLVFVLIILVGPTNQLSEYMIGNAILLRMDLWGRCERCEW